MFRFHTLPIVLGSALALVACRASNALTNNEYAKPQSCLNWVVRPELGPRVVDQPTVWLRYKDAAGTGLDLRPQIKDALASEGFALVSSPTTADYQLVATLRHFEKAQRFDGGEAAALTVEELAPIGRAVSDVRAEGRDSGDPLVRSLGDVGSSVLNIALQNGQTVAEWDLVLDLEVNERSPGARMPPSVQLEESSVTFAVDTLPGPDREKGEVRASDPNAAGERALSRNGGRLVAIAYQMTMSREEALAELLPRLPSAIASALP